VRVVELEGHALRQQIPVARVGLLVAADHILQGW
jgi:hypothetical protein